MRWEELTVNEKLEALRADIAKIFAAHNILGRDVVDDRRRLNEVEKTVRELTRETV